MREGALFRLWRYGWERGYSFLVAGQSGFVFSAVGDGDVTFLSPNKKVTKEVGLGEALKAALPRVPAALS